MAKKTTQDESLQTLLVIKQISDSIGTNVLKNQEINAPLIKRSQNMNFIVIFSICLVIGILAFFGKIDGSATVGLLGSMIGYVFGGIYGRKEK
jgi:hypothetical protein